MGDFLQSVSEFIAKNELIDTQDKVVVGFSGGPDSVALLYCLNELGYDCIAVHIDHSLRGCESDGDAEFAQTFCNDRGIPFKMFKFDCKRYAKEEALGVEEAARNKRYEVFDAVADEFIAQGKNVCIAVAQNQNDQVETLIMRLIRGTGIEGLCGIDVKRKNRTGASIVRPILNKSREDIMAFLEEENIPYRLDSSNFEPDYFRNRVRLALASIDESKPFGDKIDSKFIEKSMLRLCENAKADSLFLKELTDAAYEKAAIEDSNASCSTVKGEIVLSSKEVSGFDKPIRYRVIKKAFEDIGLKADIEKVHLLAADSMILKGVGNKVCEFPNGYRMKMNRGLLRFIAPEESFK